MTEGEFRRMKPAVEPGIRRLMAQQIPVRPRLPESPVGFLFLLPDGEGHGAVREFFLDAGYEMTDLIIVIEGVLSALQHKGPKVQIVSHPAAGKNLLLRQPVTVAGTVASPKAAVIAVIPAVIGEFDESPEIHLISEVLLLPYSGLLCQILCQVFIPMINQAHKLLSTQSSLFKQAVNQFPHHIPPLRSWNRRFSR